MEALSVAINIPYKFVELTLGVADVIVSDLTSSDQSFKEEMMKRLKDLCGVKQTVNVATFTGKWSSKNGMIITEKCYVDTIFNIYQYSYNKYNGTDTLTGVKWYNGEWKH